MVSNRKRTHGEDKSASGRQTATVSVCGSGLPTPRPESIPLEDQAVSLTTDENTDTSPPTNRANEKAFSEKALIVSKEMASVETLNVMATNVEWLAKMLETMESQASLLTIYHASTKIQEEIRAVQKEIDEEREKERREAREMRDKLKDLIDNTPNESMRERWNTKICQVIQDEVYGQLDIQIPQALVDQAHQHRVRMEQIDNDLYNAEQRRRNAHVKEKEPLHQLRIPAMSISRSSSGSTATPSTALLTPQNNLLFSTDVSTAVEDNVSPVFPKNVEQLYHYCKHDRGKLRQFLEDYGEDAPDESANQLNQALHFIGVRFHAVNPPAAPRNPPSSRLQPAVNALLSPLMIGTS